MTVPIKYYVIESLKRGDHTSESMTGKLFKILGVGTVPLEIM